MSELETMLADTVARLFGDHVTRGCIEAAEDGTWPAALWRAVEEAGLTRPHLGEAAGGVGGTWREAYVILRAVGRHAAPLPLGETMLAGWLLELAGLDVPEGPLTVAAAPASGPTDGALTAVLDDVPSGRHATHVVVVDTTGAAPRVLLVARSAAVRVDPGQNIAREARDRLTFEQAPVLVRGAASVPSDVVALYGALVRTAQMAGAMESLLAQSVQYVGERVQFGRPLAKFQAIQQELAKLAGDVAASGVAAATAFHAAARASASGRPEDARFEIAVAKTRIGDAVDRATSIAHQAHGAIGFTYEHALHFATRRLWAWRAEYGTDTFWAEALGRAALARGADALWPDLTARAHR